MCQLCNSIQVHVKTYLVNQLTTCKNIPSKPINCMYYECTTCMYSYVKVSCVFRGGRNRHRYLLLAQDWVLILVLDRVTLLNRIMLVGLLVRDGGLLLDKVFP